MEAGGCGTTETHRPQTPVLRRDVHIPSWTPLLPCVPQGGCQVRAAGSQTQPLTGLLVTAGGTAAPVCTSRGQSNRRQRLFQGRPIFADIDTRPEPLGSLSSITRLGPRLPAGTRLQKRDRNEELRWDVNTAPREGGDPACWHVRYECRRKGLQSYIRHTT